MKIKRNVIVTGFICIAVNLVSLFTFTISWFSSNYQTAAADLRVQCVDPNLLDVNYNIYEFNLTNNTGSKTDSFELGSYDTFIESRNTKLKKIIEISVKPKDGVDYSEDQVLGIEIPCLSSFLTDENKISANISNIISFKSARLGYKLNGAYTFDIDGIYDSNGEITSDNDFYTKTVNALSSVETKEFVEDPNNKTVLEVQKDNNLSFTNIEAPAHFQEIKLAIEYTYSKTLVDYFYVNSDSKIEITDLAGSSISFSDDIDNILLELI